ncbi:uncharacterized protein [Euphorbia lathyris]|uniref:uncharacterized protein n=1 Tax=Euphorbia lathyris TaxID=212925 RepID=UPI0033131B64
MTKLSFNVSGAGHQKTSSDEPTGNPPTPSKGKTGQNSNSGQGKTVKIRTYSKVFENVREWKVEPSRWVSEHFVQNEQPFCEWISQNGWTGLFSVRDETYPDLVREFYHNLKVANDNADYLCTECQGTGAESEEPEVQLDDHFISQVEEELDGDSTEEEEEEEEEASGQDDAEDSKETASEHEAEDANTGIVLVDETKEGVEMKLELWRQTLESRGFKLSRSKTEYLECKFSGRRSREAGTITLDGRVVQASDCFRYLGSIIQTDGEVDGDVAHRIKAGWSKWKSATGFLCDPGMPNRLKGKFYRTAIRPALLYGTECWAVKHCHIHKMSVAEMRMLRWMCGHTRKDRVRNEIIRTKVGVTSIENKMRENRLRWFGHVRRRALDAPVRRTEEWQRDVVVRGRERPKQTWRRVIESDMSLLGIEENMVVDRTEWRERICVADTT